MKDRRPRKLKKIAKKRKAAHDATIMVRSAMSAAMGCVGIAIVNSRPVPAFAGAPISPTEKAIEIAAQVLHTAQIIKKELSEIKDWRAYA